MLKKILALFGLTLSLSAHATLIEVTDTELLDVTVNSGVESSSSYYGGAPGDFSSFIANEQAMGSDFIVTAIQNSNVNGTSIDVVASFESTATADPSAFINGWSIFDIEFDVTADADFNLIWTNVGNYSGFTLRQITGGDLYISERSEGSSNSSGFLTAGSYSLNIDNGAVAYGITGAQFISTDMQLSLTTVPIPAAAWLFGSALIGLAGIKRKK